MPVRTSASEIASLRGRTAVRGELIPIVVPEIHKYHFFLNSNSPGMVLMLILEVASRMLASASVVKRSAAVTSSEE